MAHNLFGRKCINHVNSVDFGFSLGTRIFLFAHGNSICLSPGITLELRFHA